MSVISFKCPNCDGELIFDPASGSSINANIVAQNLPQEELDAIEAGRGNRR